MHPLAAYLLIFPLAAQADLYKCTDNTGKVTYTNSACAKAGLKEAKIIPPPPPPVQDNTAKTRAAAQPAAPKEANGKGKETVALQMRTPAQASNDKCAKLNASMGIIMDEMDNARRLGRTDFDGNENLKKLQADKNRLGCF